MLASRNVITATGVHPCAPAHQAVPGDCEPLLCQRMLKCATFQGGDARLHQAGSHERKVHFLGEEAYTATGVILETRSP